MCVYVSSVFPVFLKLWHVLPSLPLSSLSIFSQEVAAAQAATHVWPVCVCMCSQCWRLRCEQCWCREVEGLAFATVLTTFPNLVRLVPVLFVRQFSINRFKAVSELCFMIVACVLASRLGAECPMPDKEVFFDLRLSYSIPRSFRMQGLASRGYDPNENIQAGRLFFLGSFFSLGGAIFIGTGAQILYILSTASANRFSLLRRRR